MQKLFQKTTPLFYVLLAGLCAPIAIGISVWPLPHYYSFGNNVLWITENVRFTYKTTNNIVIFTHAFKIKAFNADNSAYPDKPTHLR